MHKKKEFSFSNIFISHFLQNPLEYAMIIPTHFLILWRIHK